MNSHLRLSLPAGALLLISLLVGCHDNSKDDLLTSGTASEIAVRQINNATCEERSPQDFNNVVVRESEDAVDIDRVNPDCS